MDTKRDIKFEYYSDGQYFKRCAFKPCKKLFSGPYNKLYCCDKCREGQKAWNRRLIALAANGDELKITKALRIIKKLFKPNIRGWFKVHQVKLIEVAFPFDLPTKKVKIDIYDGELDAVGKFAFYKKNDYFYFYKYID